MLNENYLVRFLEKLNGSRHFQGYGFHYRQILAEGAVMMGFLGIFCGLGRMMVPVFAFVDWRMMVVIQTQVDELCRTADKKRQDNTDQNIHQPAFHFLNPSIYPASLLI